jgi:hypothetical protein
MCQFNIKVLVLTIIIIINLFPVDSVSKKEIIRFIYLLIYDTAIYNLHFTNIQNQMQYGL